uniref:Aldehyde dehydrogenase (NAD+)/betaine-aldehyde dehydrogenase n=1 Tax=Candidatus Kentrum sp. DK TaxID=2126562 RepID=A0A450T6S1_9GAMM|nr:MAG: aldehyde dehydrogenase (NAD+)/betaine-aldehyde dehydrogenase [Candidatus Kentron sp. DK]
MKNQTAPNLSPSFSAKVWQNLIGGKWTGSTGDERIPLLDPATEDSLGSIPKGTTEDADRAVASAREAFEAGAWRRMGVRERSRVLRRVGEILLRRCEEIATAETLDQGRSLRQSRGMMLPLAAGAWEFFAGCLLNFHGRAASPEPWASAYTINQPLGVVACITPGNVPLVLGSEKLAPALAVGNSVVLKPPPECPISSVLLVECLLEAGIPEGVVNLVHGDGEPVGRRLAEHPDVDMVAFTGSTETGKAIMRLGAGNVKRLLLELGGKAPQVVFPDADVDAAVKGALWGVYLNSGQICMASTRLLLHESIYDEFVEKFVRRTRDLRVGPGIEPDTNVGPMVTIRARDKVEACIARAVEEGATVLCGGDRPRGDRYARGFWVEPTVLAADSPGITATRQEIFGPVPVVQRFAHMAEAIRMANDTEYGLAGSVWTNDLNTAMTMAEEVRAGYVWINDHLIRATGFPFGGWKQSGFGREAAAQTLDEYCNVKTVYIDRTGLAEKPRYGLL